MISAHRLTKRFGRFIAVDSVDFEIPRGEVVGFLGPNGAGKTTTIRMICGYLRPTSGLVRLDGIDVSRDPRPAQKRLGYLPETTPLYGEMRVQEYLDFRGRLFSLPRRRRQAAVEAALRRCDLAGVPRRPINQLSRGYRQRVGLAAALLHEPPVLVLDEPTAGLDPTQVREARALIRELAGDHTVLLSTHNLAEVELTCDRILMMARGRIRAAGTIEELRGRSAGEQRYVVECDSGRARCAVSALADVEAVESTGLEGPWLRLTVTGTDGAVDLREPIALAVTESGGRIRELRREAPTLERLFVRVVDEAEAPPAGRAAP